MKFVTLTLLGSLLVGAVATYATATSVHTRESVEIPTVASPLESNDRAQAAAEEFLSKLLAPTDDFVHLDMTEHMADETGELAAVPPVFVECGNGIGGVTPGIATTGNGATAQQAATAAANDAAKKLALMSGVVCKWCPVPGECRVNVGFLPGGWSILMVWQNADGSFTAIVKYTGAYFVSCTVCPPLPVDAE